jgi:predicted outer membrane repeat protein
VFLDGCLLQVEAGGLLQGIQLNQATTDGGGVFAQGAGGVILLGSALHSADLVSNHADGNGGGAFLLGAGLFSISGNISSNSADGDGGGIYATDDAGIIMEREGGSSCHDPVRCSRLSGNFAFGLGGALYIGDGSVGNVYQTYVEGNGGTGQVAYLVDTDSFLLLEGDVITGHVGGNLVQMGLGAALTIAHSTFAANPSNSWIVLLGDQSTVKLHNSIFWEDQGTVLAVGGLADVEASCLLAHESDSLPPGSVVHVGDPLFVDQGDGDFHLSSLSPALDSCPNTLYANLTRDVDGELRGVDVPAVPDAAPGSRWDIGADELHLPPVPLFADGFESGDLSNWS